MMSVLLISSSKSLVSGHFVAYILMFNIWEYLVNIRLELGYFSVKISATSQSVFEK